jgi:hypothetical protein
MLAQITGQTKAARESIFENVRPGAGRDVAMGELERGQRGQVAGALSNVFLQSFPALATLGGEAGQFGLQDLSAALSGLGGAGSALGGASRTGEGVLQARVQQQQAMFNLLGNIVGAAGGAVAGPVGRGFLGNIFKPKQAGGMGNV